MELIISHNKAQRKKLKIIITERNWILKNSTIYKRTSSSGV